MIVKVDREHSDIDDETKHKVPCSLRLACQ